jgi:hypothetical protein
VFSSLETVTLIKIKARLESGLQMLEAERRKMEAEVMEKRRKYQEEAQLGSRHAETRRRPRQWSSFIHLNG